MYFSKLTIIRKLIIICIFLNFICAFKFRKKNLKRQKFLLLKILKVKKNEILADQGIFKKYFDSY